MLKKLGCLSMTASGMKKEDKQVAGQMTDKY